MNTIQTQTQIRNQNQTQTLTQFHPSNILAMGFLAICLNVSLYVPSSTKSRNYSFICLLLVFIFSSQFEILDSSTLIIFRIVYKF